MDATTENKQIKQLARDIAKEKLAPKAAEVDHSYVYPQEGLRHLAGAGLMGLTVPVSFGGAGADLLSFVEATSEIAKACASTALIFVTHLAVCTSVLAAGSDNLKKEYLPGLTSGKKIGALAATEAASGANAFALQTSAKRNGNDTYQVTGSKVYITSGGEADVYLVAVRTGPGPTGLSMLLIEKGTPGMTFGRKDRRLGMNGVSSSEVILEDCSVPVANLLGQEGGYMAVAMPMAGVALLGAGAIGLGLAQAAFEASVEHAKSRKVNGRSLGENQGIQFLLAEMSAQIEAARCLLSEAAQAKAGGPIRLFQAKYFATEMAIDVTSKALQIHGGQGYTQDLPVKRYFRDARGLTLHFTPTEMLKESMGKMLLGLFP